MTDTQKRDHSPIRFSRTAGHAAMACPCRSMPAPRIRLWLAMLLMAVSLTAAAQQIAVRNFAPQAYGESSGIGRQNWGIDQDEAGRMLFANSSGLLVFDGEAWTVHSVPNHSALRSVKYDKQRKVIFVGASNEFGYFKPDGPVGELRYHSLAALLPQKERFFGEIWDISVGGDKGGAVTFSGKTRVFTANAELTAVQYEPQSEPYGHYAELRGQTVRGVARLGDSSLVGTAAGQLYIVDGLNARPYRLDVSPYLEQNDLFCMASLGDVVAFGTVKGGIVMKNLATGLAHCVNTHSGLQNNTVLSLHFDSTGNLWAGLDNGVAYLLPHMPYRELFASPLDNIGTGYTSIIHDGHLYLGTNQGLFLTQLPSGGLNGTRREAVEGVTGQIWNLREADGLLLCAADKGAYVVNGGKAKRIAGLQGTWNFCPLSRHPGYVLAVDYRGFALLRRQGDSFVVQQRLEGFSEPSDNIEEAADGTFWVAQWFKGVWHFELSPDMRSAHQLGSYGKGRGLFVDEGNLIVKIDGKVYVSTVDGLYGYDGKKRRLVRDNGMSSIFSSFDQSINIRQMADGSLWAYKKNFLAHAVKKNGLWKADKTSFMNIARRLQTEFGSISQVSPGITCFGAGEGFLLVNTSQTAVQHDVAPIISRVAAVSHDRDSLLYSFGYGQADTMPEVSVRHLDNYIRIEYALPEYRQEHGVSYSVFLENYDKEWTAFGAAASKEYKLGRGHYIFRVKARDLVSGNERTARIGITIRPAWYESWYAFLAYAILAFGAVGLALLYLRRMTLRRLIRQKRESELKLAQTRGDLLETELKHRTSELADSTMNIAHNNEILQQIDTRLNELSESVRREDSKATVTAAIAQLRRYIQTNIDNDDHWDKFEESFNLVYDNFLQRLRTAYPELKRNDLKLCSYLRMSLSSKEIASLMNVSERSVETARYRLRKKLRLRQGDNLTDFLSQS